MDAVLNQDTAPRILHLVLGLLKKRGGPASVGEDQNLRDAGMTSLDMVNLMLAVEGEFDLFIPETEMTPDNFSSVSAIDTLVSTLLKAA
jgi:acyl carrier protein